MGRKLNERAEESRRSELHQRLMTLMLARVILSLGVGLCFLYLVRASSFSPLYSEERIPLIVVVFVTIYLGNLGFIFALKHLRRNLIALAFSQLATDCAGASGLIYLTGGFESPLIFLFALYVTMGAIALSRQGAWFVVVLSAGGLALLCVHEIASIEFERGGGMRALRYTLSSGLYHLGLLSFIAMLTGYISEQARVAQLKLSFANTNMRSIERLNEHLLTSVHNGIIYCDPQGLIQITNRSAERLLNRRAADLLNQPLQEIFEHLPSELSPKSLSEHFNAQTHGVMTHGVTTYLESGDAYSWSEEYCQDPELKVALNVTLDLTLSMVKSTDETPQGWALILHDVTLRKRLEARNERRERLASLGEVASQIAHEVRNPLAGMLSSLELLRTHYEAQVGASSKAVGSGSGHTLDLKLIDIIEREAQRINGLTTSLLNLTRPPRAQPVDVDLTALIAEFTALEPDRIDSTLDAEFDQPFIVHVDPDHIRQVLWNILRNAWEAGSDRVEISATHRELTSVGNVILWEVTVDIADRGVGFSEDITNLDDLFKPFWSDKDQGTGLGLAISRSLIEAQEGMLTARRRPGGGAVFSITLPSVAPDGP